MLKNENETKTSNPIFDLWIRATSTSCPKLVVPILLNDSNRIDMRPCFMHTDNVILSNATKLIQNSVSIFKIIQLVYFDMSPLT